MRLHRAASHFDKSSAVDAYTPGASLYGQFDIYDDSKRDGLTVKRRVLSMDPSVAIPSRRVVTSNGITWIVGLGAVDYFSGSAIRVKYVVQAADGLAQVRSFYQVLSGSSGLSAYASSVWDKGAKEVEISSGITPVFSLFFAESEPIIERDIVILGTDWYIVRSVYPSEAGFLVAACDRLDAPVLDTVSVVTQAYSPITDGTTDTSVSVSMIRIRWQSNFEYLTETSEDYERGDIQGVILKSAATPAPGSQVITSDSVKWRVVSTIDMGTVWSVHLRRD